MVKQSFRQTRAWDNKLMLQTYIGNLYGERELIEALKAAHQTGNWERFNTHKTGIKAWLMVRQGNFKYIRYLYKDYLDELYDIAADPEELHNLAVRPEYYETKLQMRALLSKELQKVGAQFIPLLPEPIQCY